MSSVKGECLCGQIGVSVTQAAFSATEGTALCRCKNCRQSGGAVASLVVIVPDSAVQITGQPKIYLDNKTDSGATIQRAFCGNCGSPIYTVSPSIAGAKVVKLGLFDELPRPSMELFCKARPSWDKPVEGAKQFQTAPSK